MNVKILWEDFVMALIKCPECGKEISDKANSCPSCGFPIQQKIKNEKNVSGKEHKLIKKQRVGWKGGLKKHKINRIHLICVLIAMVVLTIITVFIIKNAAYNNAVKAFESKKYLEAYNYFKNSDYRKSSIYLQETLEKYCDYLIANKQFYDVKFYLDQITDKSIANKISNESNYLHALYNYKNGAFDAAYDILKTIKTYKDAEQIMDKVLVMSNIQGEWVLYSDYHKNSARGALKINGWNATAYHAFDFEEVGDCKLKFKNEETFTFFEEDNTDGISTLKPNKAIFTFETNNIEYQIAFHDNFLIIESYKDDYYKQLEKSYEPLIPWMHYDNKNQMCFEKSSNNEITKKITVPEIGMTGEQVKQTNWGEPEKINKTTYSWGTTEQWCYSNYRYIYLDNGIVTSIQE